MALNCGSFWASAPIFGDFGVDNTGFHNFLTFDEQVSVEVS